VGCADDSWSGDPQAEGTAGEVTPLTRQVSPVARSASPGGRRETTHAQAAKQWITLTSQKLVAEQRKLRLDPAHAHARRLLPARRLSPALLSPAVVDVTRGVGETLFGARDASHAQATRAQEKLYRLTCYWMYRFGDQWRLARDMCRHLTGLYDDSRSWRQLRLWTTLAERDMDSEAPTGAREELFWRDYGPHKWRLAEQLDRTVSYLERWVSTARRVGHVKPNYFGHPRTRGESDRNSEVTVIRGSTKMSPSSTKQVVLR